MSEEMHEFLRSKRPGLQARLRDGVIAAIMEACRDPATGALLLYNDEIIVCAQMVIAMFAAGSTACATHELREDFCTTLASELRHMLDTARAEAIEAGLTEEPRQ